MDNISKARVPTSGPNDQRSRRTRRDAGASLVEYALLVALIAVVCVAAVTFMGGRASTSYSDFGSRVEAS